METLKPWVESVKVLFAAFFSRASACLPSLLPLFTHGERQSGKNLLNRFLWPFLCPVLPFIVLVKARLAKNAQREWCSEFLRYTLSLSHHAYLNATLDGGPPGPEVESGRPPSPSWRQPPQPDIEHQDNHNDDHVQR